MHKVVKPTKAERRQEEYKQKVRDSEAVRVTLINVSHILRDIKPKVPNCFPEGIDPHGIYAGWMAAAIHHVEVLLSVVVEHEP